MVKCMESQQWQGNIPDPEGEARSGLMGHTEVRVWCQGFAQRPMIRVVDMQLPKHPAAQDGSRASR